MRAIRQQYPKREGKEVFGGNGRHPLQGVEAPQSDAHYLQTSFLPPPLTIHRKCAASATRRVARGVVSNYFY
jgi:hypothetical protein